LHFRFFVGDVISGVGFRPVILKVGGIASLGMILRSKGAKKAKGTIGEKQHKGGENAQPLIDHKLTSVAYSYELLVSCNF